MTKNSTNITLKIPKKESDKIRLEAQMLRDKGIQASKESLIIDRLLNAVIPDKIEVLKTKEKKKLCNIDCPESVYKAAEMIKKSTGITIHDILVYLILKK